ncbi:MAG TPA: HAD family phosphatase [Capillibacterium sp.]
MGQIKAVIFDYGGVLSTEQVPEEVKAMRALLQVGEEEFRHWYYYYRPFYDRGSTGEEYWQRVLAACRVEYNPALVAELMAHDLKSWTRINPAMLDWAAELKAGGYRLGIISNMVKEILAYMQANFTWLQGDLFASQVFSCVWRVAKPDSRIFRISLEEMGLLAGECLFIDDTEANVKAAEKLGFAVCHYREPADLTLLKQGLLPVK